MFKKILSAVVSLFVITSFSACNGVEAEPLFQSSFNDDVSTEVVEVKKEKVRKISILPMKTNLSKKDLLWCKMEKQRFLMEIMNVVADKSSYNSAMFFYSELDQEKADYFAYNTTAHLVKMGCVDDKKNDSLELTHSVNSINKNLNYLDAFLCVTSEKLTFAKEVSLRFGGNLNYNESLKKNELLDPFLKNSVISAVSARMEERQCAK